MTEHYFTGKPASKSDARVIECALRGRAFSFETDAGVFSKARVDPGSALLIEAAPEVFGRALDLGCGWGAVGVSLAKAFPGARFVLADVNERAVALARANIERNGVLSAQAVVSDGLAAVDGAFDAVYTNPPIRAGKQLIYRLFAEAHARLTGGGCLYVVIRKQQGAPSALAYLRGLFSSAEIVRRGMGYHVIRAVK
jgi:16S rRNA (guanine1207-N2)-methyltransferase